MQGLRGGVVVRYLNKLCNNQPKICNLLCFNLAFSGLLVPQMADYILLKLTCLNSSVWLHKPLKLPPSRSSQRKCLFPRLPSGFKQSSITSL
uniref:Putative ovule protein n=1 Tax=Solanum chacoense TaxID=4108 RepID=A0A0V0GTT2_SOLCH